MAPSSTLSRRRLLYYAALTTLVPQVLAFSFSYTAPTQCGPLTVSWLGGTPPYSLLITPMFNVPTNISIPANASSNGKGSFTTTLQLANPNQFLLTMSDATGLGTGGTSGVLTVADPVNGATCDTTAPTLPFTFDTPLLLQQCRLFEFDEYSGATQPVTIVGMIPLGNTFTLSPPTGSTLYNWTANIQAGTSVVFAMFDATGKTGGATDLYTVGDSNDNSCINSKSPASTITSGPSSTGTAPAQTGGSSTGGSSSNGAIIGGAVAGGLVLIIAILGALWFLMRRRRSRKDTPHISTHFGRKRVNPAVDLEPHDPAQTSPVENYEPIPFVLPPPSARDSTQFGASENGHYPPGDNSQDAGGSSSGGPSNKATEAYRNRSSASPGENRPARFILHSDAGTVEGAEEEPETVELPPQYSTINGRVVRSPTYRERNGTGNSRRSAPNADLGAGSSAGPS